MRKPFLLFTIFLLFGFGIGITAITANEKQPIKAIYIPLADHYAAIVAAAFPQALNNRCPGPMLLKPKGLAMWRGIPRMSCPGPMAM
jgi:hypothetical protein